MEFLSSEILNFNERPVTLNEITTLKLGGILKFRLASG